MRSTQDRAGRQKTTTEYINGIREVEAVTAEIIRILAGLEETQQLFVLGNINGVMHTHWAKLTLQEEFVKLMRGD